MEADLGSLRLCKGAFSIAVSASQTGIVWGTFLGPLYQSNVIWLIQSSPGMHWYHVIGRGLHTLHFVAPVSPILKIAWKTVNAVPDVGQRGKSKTYNAPKYGATPAYTMGEYIARCKCRPKSKLSSSPSLC